MCIKLYIANLAAYNNGVLDGKWFDLENYLDIDDLTNDIKRSVLHQNDGPDGLPVYEYGVSDEEYAIHDFEAPFKISEYEDIEPLLEFCALDVYDQKKAAYLYDNGNYSALTDCISNVEEVTFYDGMTLQDVAYELVNDGCFGDIPTNLEHYIDYDAIARDLSFDGYHETPEGVFYVC